MADQFDPHAALQQLATMAPPEYQGMLDQVLRTVPKDQLMQVFSDLQAVVSQATQGGETAAAEQYIAAHYGAVGVLLLRGFTQRMAHASPEAQAHAAQLVPNDSHGSTPVVDKLIENARYGKFGHGG